MSNQDTNHSVHNEIVSMLPWFVNNTLDGDKRREVLKHIENCEECRGEIQFLETLSETIQNDAESHHTVRADVDKSIANVMSRIDTQGEKNNAVKSAAISLQNKLGDLFKFITFLPFPQWSATAIAGLLVAVIGVQLYQSQTKTDYSVLSSPDVEHASMRLSIELASVDDREQAQTIIQNEASKLGQRFSIERSNNGAFTLIFYDVVGVSELSEFVVALEKQSPISRVEILP